MPFVEIEEAGGGGSNSSGELAFLLQRPGRLAEPLCLCVSIDRLVS